jgi:hypothetical protein
MGVVSSYGDAFGGERRGGAFLTQGMGISLPGGAGQGAEEAQAQPAGQPPAASRPGSAPGARCTSQGRCGAKLPRTLVAETLQTC